ncbi:PABC domain-containing protein [Durusdinium trenchii]|uniref:PABC domain-containing protein n=1 Tax=Durusdinium trenchii TaxID=1381693 RepID=A0ABP0H9A8_9DINO
MGKQRRQADPVFSTHRAFYKEIPRTADVMLVENVPEYGTEVARDHLPKHWDFRSVTIDPRHLGVPAGRTRIWILAWDTKRVQWREGGISIEEVMHILGARAVGKAGDFFWRKLPAAVLTHAQARNLSDYEKLKGWVQYPDLTQYCANERGRGELQDGNTVVGEDPHPVEWLLDAWKQDLLEPMLTWLQEQDSSFPDPRRFKFPALWQS